MIKKYIILFIDISLLCVFQHSYAIEKIVVNGLFKDKAIITIDGRQHVLKTGQLSREGALLIKSNSKEAVIEIDGQQNTYTLGTQIGNSFAEPTEGKKVIITPNSDGMYNISGIINGFHVPFVVDTGATFISMNGNVANRLGIDYKLSDQVGYSNTASGKSKIYIIKLKKVRVGDIELRNVEAAVHEGNFPIVSLLGMSFLDKLDMKREGRVMQLQKKY